MMASPSLSLVEKQDLKLGPVYKMSLFYVQLLLATQALTQSKYLLKQRLGELVAQSAC